MDRDALERAAARAARRGDVGAALSLLEVRAQAGADGARFRAEALELAEEVLGVGDVHTRAAAVRILAHDPDDARALAALAAWCVAQRGASTDRLREALAHLRRALESPGLWSVGRGARPGAVFGLLGDVLAALAEDPGAPEGEVAALRRDARRAWREGGVVHGALAPLVWWLTGGAAPMEGAAAHAEELRAAVSLSAAGPPDAVEAVCRAIGRHLLAPSDARSLWADALQAVAVAASTDDRTALDRGAAALGAVPTPGAAFAAALWAAAAADPTWAPDGRARTATPLGMQRRAAVLALVGVAPDPGQAALGAPGPRSGEPVAAMLRAVDAEAAERILARAPVGASLDEALLSGMLLSGMLPSGMLLPA